MAPFRLNLDSTRRSCWGYRSSIAHSTEQIYFKVQTKHFSLGIVNNILIILPFSLVYSSVPLFLLWTFLCRNATTVYSIYASHRIPIKFFKIIRGYKCCYARLPSGLLWYHCYGYLFSGYIFKRTCSTIQKGIWSKGTWSTMYELN